MGVGADFVGLSAFAAHIVGPGTWNETEHFSISVRTSKMIKLEVLPVIE